MKTYADKMHTPAVTVVIPSYNCAVYLPDAIDSVLQQSAQDFEVVIVDDGSSDETREVARTYLSDPRIRYVYQNNRGLPSARNRGVLEANGEFIAALDADDALEPNALETMLAALKRSGASWCVIDISKFWDGYSEYQRTEPPADQLLRAILSDDFIRRGMFFRRDALLRIGMWDEEMKNREDWDLNIRLIEADERFEYVPQALYRYRKRPNSITTGNVDLVLHYTRLLLRKHHKRRADNGEEWARKLYAANLWKLGRRYFHEAKAIRQAMACALLSSLYEFDVRRIIRAGVRLTNGAFKNRLGLFKATRPFELQ